jgi:two-component sensor histidine kinase
LIDRIPRALWSWIASAVFWPALGALFFLHEHAAWMADQPIWPEIVRSMLVQWVPYVPLTPPAFALVRRWCLPPAPPLVRMARFALLVVLLTVVFLILRDVTRVLVEKLWDQPRERDLPPFPASIATAVWRGFPYTLLHSLAVLAVALITAQQREATRREQETMALRQQLLTAQLEALKIQLQPHFLFNTLHAVGVTARHDADQAARMLALLGDLLRTTLKARQRQVVPLGEELAQLQPYLDLLRARFHDRLRVDVQVPDGERQALVPDLCLQPLVENAVKHGIEARSGAALIRIAAAREDDSLVLTVTDDGFGPPAGSLREGVGLSNLRARLQALHGDRQELTLAPRPGGGAVVTMRVPWRTESTHDVA